MSQPKPDLIELNDLIDQHCAGVIDPVDFERLQELLTESRSNRDHFRSIMNVHWALHEFSDKNAVNEISPLAGLMQESVDFDGTTYAPKHEVSVPSSRRHIALAAAVSFVTAAAVLLVFGAWFWNSQPSTPEIASTIVSVDTNSSELELNGASRIETPSLSTEDGAVVSAILQSVVDVAWSEGQSPLRAGDKIFSEAIDIESGMVELVFMSGAVAIMEGPCKIQLVDPLKGVLHSGKVRCFVPPSANGFVLETGDTRYLDLGTEFGVEVKSGGHQELHVFDGEVEVHPLQGSVAPQLIASGKGLKSRSKGSAWKSIPSDSERFAGFDQLRQRKAQQEALRHAEWKDYAKRLQQRSDLVAYFDFQTDPSRPQQLLDISGNGLHGAIIGSKWSLGRWDGKTSLEFKRPNDRVRLNIPGSFENLTYSTWLRVDGFDREFNSILLSDRFDAGDIHWQIRSTGQLDVGFKLAPDVERQVYISRAVLGYEDLARWVHLVMVVDQDQSLLCQYLDGELVESLELTLGTAGERTDSGQLKLRIGVAELGNWSPVRRYDAWPVRNFNGRMDEFIIFDRALNSAEIADLYEAGRDR